MDFLVILVETQNEHVCERTQNNLEKKI